MWAGHRGLRVLQYPSVGDPHFHGRRDGSRLGCAGQFQSHRARLFRRPDDRAVRRHVLPLRDDRRQRRRTRSGHGLGVAGLRELGAGADELAHHALLLGARRGARPDGRYYLYYNQPCNTYGGVSDSPVGPWTPLTAGDGLVIKDRLVKDVITLDTQIFEDKDGTLYGYWGTWGIFPKSGCGIGVFNADMKSFARLGMIPNTQAKDFFEAPFMIERNGTYYFTYSSGSCHDASYRVQYAVGNKPDGEFTMGPNNPILASTADGTVHGPGHHSILKHGDDYYIIYHRHDIPVTPNGMHRQTCADRLVFEGDGVIKKVEPTHRGIGPLGPKARGANLAFQRQVTASSYYRDTLRNHDYKPDYAVDDNNATLWRPGDNRMGHWLTVDLGTPQRVRRTETQFEYGTWYYQYLIESSLDGQTWKTFADRRQNTRWGSPMVDDGEVEARYLRLTVTGTELPGLFGAVWNFKAFGDAPADPLLAMADRSFDQCVVPRTPGGGADIGLGRAGGQRGTRRVGRHRCPAHPPRRVPAPTRRAGPGLDQRRLAWRRVPRRRRQASRGSGRWPQGRPLLRVTGPDRFVSCARSLAGNSSFTVAAWVHNPEIGESECLVSWAGRGGPDATTAQFGYGTHREFGAVGHWGFADLGFRDAASQGRPGITWRSSSMGSSSVSMWMASSTMPRPRCCSCTKAGRSMSALPNRARSISTATSLRCGSTTRR